MKKIENCPICGNNHFVSYLKTKDFFFTKEPFELVQCNDCGFILTSSIPLDLGPYYETEDYLSHSAEKQNIIAKVYRSVRNINIKNKFNLVKEHTSGRSILDIGCGTGELLSYFKKMGWDTMGVEPNESARSFAKENYTLSIEPEASIKSIKDSSFDAITMWHVLEHVPDLNDRMEEVFRICKENGTVFIAVPNIESPDAKHYGKFWAGIDVPRHLYHFSKDSINRLAKKHNLEIIKYIPMKFDAYYVSMLSEKYKNNKAGKFSAAIEGFLSNMKAKRNNNYSSMIFVLKKSISKN